jgi:hypothetical protein
MERERHAQNGLHAAPNERKLSTTWPARRGHNKRLGLYRLQTLRRGEEMNTLKVLYDDGHMQIIPCYDVESERTNHGYVITANTPGGQRMVEVIGDDVAFFMVGTRNVHSFRPNRMD